MFPFTSCVTILRRAECPTDWKQINGTMNFHVGCTKDYKRCGNLTFDSRDKNAVCIQMIGDAQVTSSPVVVATGPDSVIGETDRTMLENLALPEVRLRLRSRFMSVSKGRQQRKSSKHSLLVKLLLDESYDSPARLRLLRVGDWDFNIFKLDNVTGGRSLLYVAFHLFQSYGFIQSFHLDTVRLVHFLSLVEQSYHESNPYHNSVHAADVAQSMHSYLQEKMIHESTSDIEKMAAIVAALSHDLDHPGVNNTFLIVTCNLLATLYENVSVLENHHWRSAVGILQETGLLNHLCDEKREWFVKLLKVLILATDITRQQEFLLKFNKFIDSGEFQYKTNEEHRQFMLQIALKCADISNPCRPWKISQIWSKKICQEFFLQGDTERTLNITVTPLCDRYGNTIANIQHGFIQFVVSPLFKAWDKFLGSDLSAQMMYHLFYNQSKWKSIMDSGADIPDIDSDISERQFDDDNVERPQRKDGVDKKIDVVTTNIGVGAAVSDGKVTLDVVREGDKRLPGEPEEDEGKSEEDDIVENDVNLLYHYQTESEESGRCLSPVSEDSEKAFVSTGSIRRYSAPYVVRKDLNFYLGLRKDLNLFPTHMVRRQSLPTTVMYFHGSPSNSPSPRSLSMDALVNRPKISNLSTSLEMSFLNNGVVDPQNFTPLNNQILMLQGGSLTKFVSNTGLRRASYDPSVYERQRYIARYNINPDYAIPPFEKSGSNRQVSTTGLASSWPTMTRRSTTNGSAQHIAVSAASTPQSASLKCNSDASVDELSTSNQISPISETNQ